MIWVFLLGWDPLLFQSSRNLFIKIPIRKTDVALRLSPPGNLLADRREIYSYPSPKIHGSRWEVRCDKILASEPKSTPLISGGGRRAVGDNTHGAHAEQPLMPWGPSHISLPDNPGDCPGSGIHAGV